MGHYDLNVADVAAHKRFWGDGLRGEPMKVGTTDVIRFHNVLVFLRPRVPTGGTKGTTVNHVGLQVPDLRSVVGTMKAAGYPIVTEAELRGATGEIEHVADQDTFVAFVMGPDELKLELFENRTLPVPIANHHIHFATHQVDEMKAWYVKVFGATPGTRGAFEAADLPGVNLTYSAVIEPQVRTRGRILDHIGFEIRDLEAFCQALEAMGIRFDLPYSRSATGTLGTAFLTDPWGTYIELTEGLDVL